MTTYYYDVVVMGMDIGPLAAGALLAKRGFRVLVVGQNTPPDRYHCYNYHFTRRPFVLAGAESPAVRRVVEELSMGQLFQHAVSLPDPVCQLVLPRLRINIHRDPGQLEEEVRRELPDEAHSLKGALESVGRINGEIDKLFSGDFVLPPETFMERRELSRIEVQNPFRAPHLIASTLEDARLPEAFDLPVRIETAGAVPLAPLVYYRQLGAWLFGTASFAKGRDGLGALLADQILGQGGDVHPRQQIREIAVSKGRITGIRIAGRDEMVGCQVVLSHLTPKELSSMIEPAAWTKRFRILVEECPESPLGYAVNLGVNREVIPEGLANTTFVSPQRDLGDGLIRIEQVSQEDDRKAALNISCVVPADNRNRIASGELRDSLLDSVRSLIPYLDDYLEVLHSPFDGFGPLDFTGKAEGNAPPLPHPEEVPVWPLRPPPEEGILGVGNWPYRTGIKGLLLSGDQVVSGLGTEGELLAAWGAARIAGKMDPRRERLVRSMRAKVEM